MLFTGGIIVGIIICLGIEFAGYMVWRKILKKKVDEAVRRAELKVIEKSKESN